MYEFEKCCKWLPRRNALTGNVSNFDSIGSVAQNFGHSVADLLGSSVEAHKRLGEADEDPTATFSFFFFELGVLKLQWAEVECGWGVH